MIDRSAAADKRQAKLANEPTENADRNDPTLPIDRADPIEPIDRIELRERMHRIESCESIDHSEPLRRAMMSSSQNHCVPPAARSGRVSASWRGACAHRAVSGGLLVVVPLAGSLSVLTLAWKSSRRLLDRAARYLGASRPWRWVAPVGGIC